MTKDQLNALQAAVTASLNAYFSGVSEALFPTVVPPVVTGNGSINPAIVAYQGPTALDAAGIAFIAKTFKLAISPDPVYLPQYKKLNPKLLCPLYDNYYCLYVGEPKYQAMVAYCKSTGVNLEVMFLHFKNDTQTGFGLMKAGSRIPTYGMYGVTDLTQPGARVVCNVGGAAYQAFNAQWQSQSCQTNYGGATYDGIFVDNTDPAVLTNHLDIVSGYFGAIAEYPTAPNYAAAAPLFFADVVACCKYAFGVLKSFGKGQMFNVSETTSIAALLPYSTGMFAESVIQPTKPNWENKWSVADYGKAVAANQAANVPTISSVNYNGTENDVQRINALSIYLLYANSLDYFSASTEYETVQPQVDDWFNAMGFNFGAPIDAATVISTGSDPSRMTDTYQVLRRRYANATVLYKSYPQWDSVVAGSATSIALDKSYKILNADGTFGGTVTGSVLLQNGMGLILVPV